MARLALWSALAAGGVLAASAACNTPQIPITPSEVPTDSLLVTDLGGGEYQLTGKGTVGPGDRLYVFDRMNGDGVIAVGDISGNVMTGPLIARPGDLLELWYYDVDWNPPAESPHDCVPLAVGPLPAIDPTRPSCH